MATYPGYQHGHFVVCIDGHGHLVVCIDGHLVVCIDYLVT
jgi:hypothetical protein